MHTETTFDVRVRETCPKGTLLFGTKEGDWSELSQGDLRTMGQVEELVRQAKEIGFPYQVRRFIFTRDGSGRIERTTETIDGVSDILKV